MFGFSCHQVGFSPSLLLTNEWPAVVPREVLPWIHHPSHCILVTISLCGPLWSGSCSLPLLRLLINPFPEELGRNFFSHIVAVFGDSICPSSIAWSSHGKCICSLFKSLHIITSSNFFFLFAVLCSFSLTLLTTQQFFTDALTVISAC